MKRYSVVFLILCLMLAGCGAAPVASSDPVFASSAEPTVSVSEAGVSPVRPEAVYTAEESSAATVSEEQQRVFLMDHYGQWAFPGAAAEPWFYTYTDLDHNGRLEVLTASTQGTGIFTYAECWEVNASFSGLDHCTEVYAEQEFFSWPELVVDEAPCYYDPSAGLYHYLFTDLVREGASHYYETLIDVCLSDGVLGYQSLATRETQNDEGGVHIFCRDAAGNTISEQDYESWPSRFYEGMEAGRRSFSWVQVDAPHTNEYLPAGPAVVVTKDPSGETLPVGGKAWFISHADNADTLKWMLVSPDGVYYTLEDAMEALPGLQLEELPQDTLGVSNVPAAIDGWGVVAWFFGPGGSAESGIAYISIQ